MRQSMVAVTALFVVLVSGLVAAADTSSGPWISGCVRSSLGAGVPGVSVSSTDGAITAVTDSTGAYSVPVTNGWSGVFKASKTGYTLSPSGRSYSLVSSDIPTQDYTISQWFLETGSALPFRSQMSQAWCDYDNDGDYDLALSGCNSTGTDVYTKLYRNDAGALTVIR